MPSGRSAGGGRRKTDHRTAIVEYLAEVLLVRPFCGEIPMIAAATRRKLDSILPDDLRYAVRDGRALARIFDDAGWHFSYLTEKVGIQRKLAAFSNQEYNNASFLETTWNRAQH
jgi:hypothetical protein